MQGQLEVFDREWAILYCWHPTGSAAFHIKRDPAYWELLHAALGRFYWDHLLPALQARDEFETPDPADVNHHFRCSSLLPLGQAWLRGVCRCLTLCHCSRAVDRLVFFAGHQRGTRTQTS